MYGNTWVQVTFSQLFSKPRCRNPTSIFASVTVSPSSSTTIFVTPCVAGCDGPMLIVIRLLGSGASSALARGGTAAGSIPCPFVWLAIRLRLRGRR